MTFHHTIFAHIKAWLSRYKKLIIAVVISFTLIVAIVAGGIFAYTKIYAGRVYPGVIAGGIELGGLTQEETVGVLDGAFNKMLDQGLTLKLGEQSEKIDLRLSGVEDPDLARNLITFDAQKIATEAMALGRSSTPVLNIINSLLLPIQGKDLDLGMIVSKDQIAQNIHDVFKSQEDPGVPTDYEIKLGDEISVSINVGKRGHTINTNVVLDSLTSDARDFKIETQNLSLTETEELITESDAADLIDNVKAALEAAPYELTYSSQSGRDYVWKIEQEEIAAWIKPVRQDKEVKLILDADAAQEFFDLIHSTVDIKPRNASFVIEDGKVKEFVGSLSGVSFDDQATLNLLNEALGQTDVSLPIVVVITQPEITTGSINDFGISEILGVGTSNFAGSPRNRILNIKNGAALLNGMLVAPGETASLIDALKPFTLDNGYLSELVIKGDEIKPEIGGGLCQIGTTTFRAVMNSGLEVVERSNHSLVVSYYNDPANHNPGTDATIYEPAPDLKFKNDTANHILLTTEVDMDNMELIFTFWGTPDGRHGYYTPPKVLSWSGYGETVRKETTDLAPGVEKCQTPHPGATASFDYFVDYADGTQFKKNYTSVYRSLPKICLVGVEKLTPEGDGTTPPTDGTIPPETPTEVPSPETPVEQPVTP